MQIKKHVILIFLFFIFFGVWVHSSNMKRDVTIKNDLENFDDIHKVRGTEKKDMGTKLTKYVEKHRQDILYYDEHSSEFDGGPGYLKAVECAKNLSKKHKKQ